MNRRKFIAGAAAGAGALAMGKRATAGEGMDLAFTNVNAFVDGSFKRMDVGVAGGVMSHLGEPGSLVGAAKTIKGDNLHLSPGWVDLHVHYVDPRHGKFVGSSIKRLGLELGVTGMLDVGTTGADNYDRLEQAVADDPSVPCFALLYIAREGIKITDFYRTKKGWEDFGAMERVLADHPDRIKGFKYRADSQVSPKDDRLYYVRKIREAGDLFKLPAMIHIGDGPPFLSDILPLMKEGDIVTHFLRGQGNSVIGENGKLLDAVKDAYARGVKFDLGHGMGSFEFDCAEKALNQHFDDFTVSSDLYLASQALFAKTYANVLTSLLAAGMPLTDIIQRCSVKPAPFLGLQRELKLGAEATLTVFSVRDGDFTCKDVTGKTRRSKQRIIPEFTLMRGELHRSGGLDRKKFLSSAEAERKIF